MNLNDTRRQEGYLPTALNELTIYVVGNGGVGSHVVQLVSRMRIGNNGLLLFDGDVVEAHNIPNQQFLPEHIGQKKVTALHEQVQKWSNEAILVTAIADYVTDRVDFKGVVFLCLDSMDARRSIMRTSILGNPNIQLVIETRMDAGLVEVFIFDPKINVHCVLWEAHWFPDSAAENLAGCNGHIAIPTATSMTADVAVQLLINHFRNQTEQDPNHLRLNLHTWKLATDVWPTTLDEDDY